MTSLLPLVLLAAQAQTGAPIPTAPTPATPTQESLPALKKNVGDMAPDFTVETPGGKPLKLSDFRGKVVVLDYWATWCGPCQLAMPKIQNVYRRLKGQDVVVLAVNVWDERSEFDKWIKENSGTKYDFTFAYEKSDRADRRKSSMAKQVYGVFGIPMVFVIDKEGRIAETMLGAHPDEEEQLTAALAKLGVKTKA